MIIPPVLPDKDCRDWSKLDAKTRRIKEEAYFRAGARRAPKWMLNVVDWILASVLALRGRRTPANLSESEKGMFMLPTAPNDLKTGSCLCGEIVYRVSGPLRPVIACHCRQCQKTSGFHVAATSVQRDHIAINGTPRWYQSSGTARRAFCGTCGSNLFWDGGGENLSIFAGTLDGKTGLSIAGHIFCADKGDFYDIPDDVPQAMGADGDLTTFVPSAE